RFAGGKKLEISNHLLEQVESFANLLPFVFGQRAHGIGERLDTALAALPHQADPFGRGFQTDAAAVFGGVAAHQAGALESGDDAAHRGRANLFRVSEFAKRPWSAEDEDGKRGELGRADAAFPVAGAQPAQQVNGGRVELIGDFCRGQGRSRSRRCRNKRAGFARRRGISWGGDWRSGGRGNGRRFLRGRFFVLGLFVLDRGHGR